MPLTQAQLDLLKTDTLSRLGTSARGTITASEEVRLKLTLSAVEAHEHLYALKAAGFKFDLDEHSVSVQLSYRFWIDYLNGINERFTALMSVVDQLDISAVTQCEVESQEILLESMLNKVRGLRLRVEAAKTTT
jgi:hypothetical protein